MKTKLTRIGVGLLFGAALMLAWALLAMAMSRAAEAHELGQFPDVVFEIRNGQQGMLLCVFVGGFEGGTCMDYHDVLAEMLRQKAILTDEKQKRL